MYKIVETSLLRIEESRGPYVKTAKDFYHYCKDIADLAQEAMHVVTVNQRNRITNRHMISLGTLTQALVRPREVLRPAILEASAAICLVHNHPSGDTIPSQPDIDITERIQEACEIMGIRLLDSIIIGYNGYYSFVDEGKL